MRYLCLLLLACLTCFSLSASQAASYFFSDGFDTANPLANNWTVASQPDSYVSLVDYSAFDLNSLFGVGTGSPVSIPEAPNSHLVGGPSTTGVVFAANAVNGVAAAANLISHQTFNRSKFTFQYDVYMSTGAAALAASNATEMTIWGVGRTNTAVVGYGNRTTAGNGTWGWLAGDNGVGSEDAAIFRDTTELVDIGDTFDVGAGVLFDDAFDFDFANFAHNSPLFEWVTVKVKYDGSNVTVSFNDVAFLTAVTPLPAGSLAVGYADPFGSISASPDTQFGVIDNVILVPEPTSIVILVLAGAAFLGPRR